MYIYIYIYVLNVFPFGYKVPSIDKLTPKLQHFEPFQYDCRIYNVIDYKNGSQQQTNLLIKHAVCAATNLQPSVLTPTAAHPPTKHDEK